MINSKLKQQSGLTIAFAVVLAAVMGISVLAMARLMDFNNHQSSFFNSMNESIKLAETGMNNAIAYLSNSTDLNNFNNVKNASETWVEEQHGWYQNKAYLRQIPKDPIYYIISTGRQKTRGPDEVARLHSYVRVSNVGEYFSAVRTSLSISQGRDIGEGKIYAPTLTFLANGTGNTLVKTAEYQTGICPPVDIGDENNPSDDRWVTDNNICQSQCNLAACPDMSFLVIGGVSGKVPTYNKAGLIFPEVQATDLENWKKLAGPHIKEFDFKGDIYPPGYPEYDTDHGNSPGDCYPCTASIKADGLEHSTDKLHHIYFSDGDMFIRGRVHGQVLFVAKGDIHITGEIIKADETGTASADTTLPGGSKAHQAVLISQGTIYINDQAYIGVYDATDPTKETRITGIPTGPVTQRIRAFIMAPNASLTPLSYVNSFDQTTADGIESLLKMDFKGTQVLTEVSSLKPNRFPTVFRNNSVYAYDESFRNFPPPYLPAITEIYYVFEETVSNSGIFGATSY